ncbi:MAG: FGGY family carbohydrate kinase [Oscillibacter sp.]|nr:FGGY family carbohydrate kinase [Oscillibacter sp.]
MEIKSEETTDRNGSGRGGGRDQSVESVALWDKSTGQPLCPSVVWQCGRAPALCRRLDPLESREMIQMRTGLRLSTFFSAAKIAWILENIPDARERAQKGKLCMGTMDCWAIWTLTGGRVHKTDVSNASRTQLFNICIMTCDRELCNLFDIPESCLPEVCDSDALFGNTDLGGLLPKPVPIHACVGDSHAVMFSHGCVHRGDVMCACRRGSCKAVRAVGRTWNGAGRTAGALSAV